MWRMSVELLGVEPEDVHVELSSDWLTVRGPRESVADFPYGRSVSYRRIERTIRLPESVDPARVTATYKDGVLEVLLPDPTAARRIPIAERPVPVVTGWLARARQYARRVWRKVTTA